MTARQPRTHVSRCADCGWSSRPTTPGLADYARRKHSCEKHRAAAAASERARQRDAAIDRTPKVCGHKVARHEHGTHAMYVLDRCRCVPCAAATSQYEQDRVRNIAYGRSDFTDPAPVREHIASLAAAGVGLKRVAATCGVSSGTLTKIVYGHTRPDGTRRPPATRVRKATAEAILAVSAADMAPGAMVDAAGTRRRVQALAALGWSVGRLAADFGINRQALDGALTRRSCVRASTASAVREAFTAIGDTPAEAGTPQARAAAARTLNRAAAAGWPPPAAWDPDQIDDPTAEPPVREAWSPAPGRGVLDLDEWVLLVAGGEDPHRAARRCGVSWSAVEAAISRTGHERARRLLHELRAAA